MSTSSARRVRERLPPAEKITAAAGKPLSTGKENPRPTSRIRAATQKPVPRTDKPEAYESRADPRARKSTSSVPRGRSSSPSEFFRVSSDSKNNTSRVSLGPPQKKVNNSLSNEQSGGRSNLRNRVSKYSEKGAKTEIPFVKVASSGKKEGDLPVRNGNGLDDFDGNFSENLKNLNLRSSGVGSCSRGSKLANKPSNKYPSKLHEKLAFLEEKVKRISSEIKNTKEMLDSNNPDTSKVILSDIQEKISVIEKAMGVGDHDGDSKMIGIGDDEEKEVEKEFSDSKSLINGLNVEELEGRLFPHDKLIRDRKISKIVGKGKVLISSDDPLSKKEMEAGEIQEADDALVYAEESSSKNVLNGGDNDDTKLMADENLDEFDGQERLHTMVFENEVEESFNYQLNDIGEKSATGGWFVSEGESVLLTHDDGSCSFYDITNNEEKSVYKPPPGISPNMWHDCWIIRAPSADGCSGKYIVSASAGNSHDSGFCSWDFYTKDIRAFHFENESARVRTALAPLSNNSEPHNRKNSTATKNRQWYNPCGPLIVSTSTYQRIVQIYDIRDGDRVMRWDLGNVVSGMDYSSPLQWRNRGKVVVAESDSVSLWDVSSIVSQKVMSVSSSGGRISALHVNNWDAEIGGGIRQRISSPEAEVNDGVFCTSESINVLDFRKPSGIAIKIPKTESNSNTQSAFSCGDSIYIGCSNLSLPGKKQSSSQIQHFSLRKQRLLSSYSVPEVNALTQVWGNSDHVMGVSGLGLFVFDALKDNGISSVSTQNVKEVIGKDDMYMPSFDYSGSRVLVISRDRPACWKFLC